MKKFIYPFLFAIVGALIFASIGFFRFVSFGANDCDMPGKSCNCFCCNSFGLRGYEACGNYGLLLGAGAGILFGLIIYLIVKHKN
ncbi:MAG: hypothetical protein NTY12_04520 [Candidatus Falkowbacteria bacterium]|nr:hypothetical protein [Candidatus Falkowbacteria bacterium]